MMKVIQATFFIKAEKREAFLADILPLVEAARKEAGCIDYQLYESFENKNQFVMIEQWQDQAAIESHNQQPLLQQLFQHMPDYAAQKTSILTFDKEA
jgi:quinol monooxygenase YgiN